MTFKKNFIIGLMLFALFLGAGNIIFPPYLGQMAGENLAIAMSGFLITGVGIPLLAVASIAYSGSDLQSIAKRVHPLFGILFTVTIYMAIGPFFGIPRTATASYEIGVIPFLPESLQGENWTLFLFTLLFFIITVLFALNPMKLVDRIGKLLTPLLFVVIGALAIKSFITPMGGLAEPQGDFATYPFSRSFIEGYLTMDGIAALVFGIVIINAIRFENITEKRTIMKATLFAGIVAAIGLSLVYISLSYIGATSVNAIGLQENGGAVLALASNILYGKLGIVILALTIFLACLTTAIGLVSACAQYFTELFPRLSYKTNVFLFAAFSTIVANYGLTKIISFSIPVLLIVYPISIVLIILSFADKYFKGSPLVYILALSVTGFISIFDGLKKIGLDYKPITSLLSYLPLYKQQLGWLLPAIIAVLLGLVIINISKKGKSVTSH